MTRRLTSSANALILKVMRKLSLRRHPGETMTPGPAYWDAISDQFSRNYYHDTVVGQLKRDVHLRLITRWCGDLRGKILLKTDLFEEAHGTDQFLFDLAAGRLRVGIDISPLATRRAVERAHASGEHACTFVAGDVLALPFRPDSFDLIVSNSTLDHFSSRQHIGLALRELYRVLKPGGILVVTLDNPHSLSYLVGRLKRLVRPDPFFMGHTLSRSELALALARIGYHVTDTTAILHGLENHSSDVMKAMGQVGGRRLHAAIRTVFARLERLEAAPTRYLTGAFIAARAVKAKKAVPAGVPSLQSSR